MSAPAGSNLNRVFEIAGYDVSHWVKQVQGIDTKISKPEWGALPDVPRITITFRNDINQMSVLSPTSLLYKTSFNNIALNNITGAVSLKVFYKQGSTLLPEWIGYIEQAITDTGLKQTVVTGISPFSLSLDSPALITLGDAATPAALSQAIFTEYNIPTNAISYARADAYLQNLVSCRVDPNLFSANCNLMTLQTQLAIAGAARIWAENGEMFFEPYGSSTLVDTLDLGEPNIMSAPKIQPEPRQPRAFSVNFLYGNDVRSNGWTSARQTQTNDFGPNAIVQLNDLTSAEYNADTWETISNLSTILLTFGILYAKARYLNLGSGVTFTWTKINMNKVPLEIVAYDRTDKLYTTLSGRMNAP